MSLVHKYHPHVFEDVRDQDRAIRTILAQLRLDVPTPLLLCGPPGVGKTTNALIVARALNCLSPAPSGSPCLVCEKCLEFDDPSARTWFFLELNAARLGGKDAAAYLDDVARSAPLGGARRRVIFIDEAHALSREAQDNLLNVLELLGVAAIILATNRPERLTPALRSRCLAVPLDVVATPALITHGREICAQENIAFESDALAMLAGAAQGQMRDFLQKLGEVAALGPVTVAATAGAVDLAWADTVVTALTRLLRNGVADASTALAVWRGSPGTKAQAVRDAWAFVAQRVAAQASPCPTSAAFLAVSPPALADFAAAVVARAAALGVAPDRCAVEWSLYWSACAPQVFDETDLHVRLWDFAWRVCPPSVVLPPAPVNAAPVVTAPPRRRAVLSATARVARVSAGVNARGLWLTKREVAGEYLAATLLPQRYGVWFNVRWVLRYGDYGVTGPRAALALFSRVTHELGMRVRDWAGDPAFRLHWLAQHEGYIDGELLTYLLLYIPPALVERARVWLVDDFLPSPAGALVHEFGPDVWRTAPGARPHVTHWSLVRELWRIVPADIVVADEAGLRRPLRTVLGVPPQQPRTPTVLPPRVRRWSASHTLGSAVWRAALEERFAFVSTWTLGSWGALDGGWELDEHGYRATEAARRARALDEVRAQLPPGVSAAQDAAREERLRALRETWPLDPMKRPRPRPLW